MSIKIISEKEAKEEVRARFQNMLNRKPILERAEPLLRELFWIIKEGPNRAQRQKNLPDYCYNILELFHRTILRAFPTYSEIVVPDQQIVCDGKTAEYGNQEVRIDCDKLGALLGIAMRSMRFLNTEAEGIFDKEGGLVLDKGEYQRWLDRLLRSDWPKRQSAELPTLQPGQNVEEMAEKPLAAFKEQIAGAIGNGDQIAYQYGADAMTQLHQGIARGTSGFLDEKGSFVGEGKIPLMGTYLILLIAWPEIEEMIRANPPKSRNDLWDWLAPFSYANIIEIKDLDQLNRLCESIKLKLKRPGAPGK